MGLLFFLIGFSLSPKDGQQGEMVKRSAGGLSPRLFRYETTGWNRFRIALVYIAVFHSDIPQRYSTAAFYERVFLHRGEYYSYCYFTWPCSTREIAYRRNDTMANLSSDANNYVQLNGRMRFRNLLLGDCSLGDCWNFLTSDARG